MSMNDASSKANTLSESHVVTFEFGSMQSYDKCKDRLWVTSAKPDAPAKYPARLWSRAAQAHSFILQHKQ